MYYEDERRDDDDERLSSIKLDSKIYNRLKILAKKKDTTIKKTITQMVENYIGKEELFQRYSPLLHIITKTNSSLFLKDEKEGKIVEVFLKYKESRSNDNTITIYCDNCKSDYCVHTSFVMGSSDIGELKLKKCVKNSNNNNGA
jgi:hypothetical protein